KGVDFTDVPDDDATLAFLIELGYKGPLYKHTNIENIDYPELIWEDLAFQIDHRKEKRSRRENMPFPRFTKIIINHFINQHKSFFNLKYQHYHTIKYDGIVSRLKFVRICEDYQEYGLPIPETILTEAIKQSKSYQMFIKYSTGQIPPKKIRGKGSQGKKTIDTHVADVDVSEESDPEPPKRKTASRRVVKKKVTISADDNIISDDPDVSLELGKSINKTKVEEAEAARQVHATHARIGVPSLTLEEQEAVDTMQALKESRKTNRRQPGTRGSNERTVSIPWVPDESTVVSATSSEGTKSEYSKEDQVDDEEKDYKDGDADDEGDDHINMDAEMAEPETVKHENKEKDVLTDAAKPDVEKNAKEEGDAEKAARSNIKVKESTEFPLPSFSLSVSSGFETTNLPPIHEILTETPVSLPHVTPTISTMQQTSTPILTPPIITDAPTITTAVHESDALFAVQLRVAKLEKDQIHKLPKNHTPTVDLEQESEKIPSEILKIKKEQAEKQKMPKFTIKSTDKVELKEFNQKSALYQTMHANKSFNRNLANHRLYHALMEALIEDENAMDKGVDDTIKDHKRKHDDNEDDEDSLARPKQGKKTKRRRTKESESSKKPSTTKETPKGKAPSKGSKTGKSAFAKEPVEEPTAEVVMDDTGEDAVCDDDQP
ncbi:hypothetical protein Tco_0585195, partial [Tanacetum coccineum]